MQTMTEHAFVRPAGAADQNKRREAEDIEAGTSFQLPDGRWISTSSRVPSKIADPTP
jgi:hypothetical protein